MGGTGCPLMALQSPEEGTAQKESLQRGGEAELRLHVGTLPSWRLPSWEGVLAWWSNHSEPRAEQGEVPGCV